MGLLERTALITGASRGLGRATALRLAREGAAIGLNYVADADGRNLADAQAVAAEIAGLGGASLLLQADVSDEAQAAAMAAAFLARFGRIDILVNNAGIIRDVTLKKMTRAEWDPVIATNLTGVFHCTKAVFEPMREAGYGRIVSIASVVGQTGNIGQANYAAAKAGIIGFTKAIAREGARRGITANAIAPGFIETEMTANIPEAKRAELAGQIPVGHLGAPEDIAAAVAFLASDEASYITGQVLAVNGGLYM